MHSGEGHLVETYLDAGGRLICPQELVPSPGQYLLAHDGVSDSPLPVPIFFSESNPNGFRAAPPLPSTWRPGTRLFLRGPLGRGFSLSASARRVALIALDDSPSRLRGLIPLALRQDAAVTLVCESVPDDFPDEVEIQPFDSMYEIFHWADYAAFDVAREKLFDLRTMLTATGQTKLKTDAQVLIRTPMPCGALAECGVCAVTGKNGWMMACKDGPVFDLYEII